MKRALQPLILLGVCVLSACAVGPDYKKPSVNLPAAWKLEKPWRESVPRDAARKGEWWEIFNDSYLNTLEHHALAQNQTLAAATARLKQAQAIVTINAAGLFPQAALTGGAARRKSSENRPLSNYATSNESVVQNDFTVSFAVNYEADLFGRVRRSVEAVQASAEQTGADLENTRLLLTAEIAADYFSLRQLDSEIEAVQESIALQKRALEFVTARHNLGAASGLDVAQQQAQLDNTTTQVHLLSNQRAQYEHALASLVGTPAPDFSVPTASLVVLPPAVPPGVPSDILERRPDIASAERAMAAANARIGVAKAAFYPSIFLSPIIGNESNELSNLFNTSSLLWSLGISATQTLFNAGRDRANVVFAEAGYEATVAAYRQTVLTAMQEVENGITGVALLDRASMSADAAVKSAQRVLDLANSRYSGGLATYLDVVIAQQAVLNGQRQATQIRGQQLLLSVYLIKALGGGWQEN